MALSMRTNRFTVTPRAIRVFALSVLWICIGAYFGWHVYNLFRAPILVVENPPHDIMTQEASLVLSGYVQKESEVTVNGNHVDTQKDGSFHDDIALESGMNILEVRAMNKFGNESVVARRVVKQ